jgi:hypothetical protein
LDLIKNNTQEKKGKNLVLGIGKGDKNPLKLYPVFIKYVFHKFPKDQNFLPVRERILFYAIKSVAPELLVRRDEGFALKGLMWKSNPFINSLTEDTESKKSSKTP